MLTDERTLKPGLFPLPDARVARNILIPGFRAATTVRGAFGWFTAGWIQQLAPGLAVHLTRDDTDPMEFTVAPALFPAERGAVEPGRSNDGGRGSCTRGGCLHRGTRRRRAARPSCA